MIIRKKEDYEQALEDLADLKRAKKKILVGGQSYSIGTNQLTRASLKEINTEIKELETAINAYEQTGSTRRIAKRVIPVD